MKKFLKLHLLILSFCIYTIWAVDINIKGFDNLVNKEAENNIQDALYRLTSGNEAIQRSLKNFVDIFQNMREEGLISLIKELEKFLQEFRKKYDQEGIKAQLTGRTSFNFEKVVNVTSKLVDYLADGKTNETPIAAEIRINDQSMKPIADLSTTFHELFRYLKEGKSRSVPVGIEIKEIHEILPIAKRLADMAEKLMFDSSKNEQAAPNLSLSMNIQLLKLEKTLNEFIQQMSQVIEKKKKGNKGSISVAHHFDEKVIEEFFEFVTVLRSSKEWRQFSHITQETVARMMNTLLVGGAVIITVASTVSACSGITIVLIFSYLISKCGKKSGKYEMLK